MSKNNREPYLIPNKTICIIYQCVKLQLQKYKKPIEEWTMKSGFTMNQENIYKQTTTTCKRKKPFRNHSNQFKLNVSLV